MPKRMPDWVPGDHLTLPIEDVPLEPTLNWLDRHGIYMASDGSLRLSLNRLLAITLDGVGVITAVGGIAAAGGFAAKADSIHTGGVGGAAADHGTDTTMGATTEVNACIIQVPQNVLVTGIAIFNGALVTTDKYVLYLYDSAGVVIANTALAGVVSAGIDTYQRIPLTAPVTIVGPAAYHIGVTMDGTTDNHHTHAIGAFSCGTHVGHVFGTPKAITPDTTFTAGDGPLAQLYT